LFWLSVFLRITGFWLLSGVTVPVVQVSSEDILSSKGKRITIPKLLYDEYNKTLVLFLMLQTILGHHQPMQQFPQRNHRHFVFRMQLYLENHNTRFPNIDKIRNISLLEEHTLQFLQYRLDNLFY